MVPFIVLLQTLIFLHASPRGGMTARPAVCAENLPLGSEVNLTIDCHSSLSPWLEYAAVDREAFMEIGKFSLDYVCSSPGDSELEEERRELLRSVVVPSDTVRVPQTLTPGDSCTFYGCYFTHNFQNPSPQVSFALEPTSCVVDVDECVLGTHSCNAHSKCVNTIGGHECPCDLGYTGGETGCVNIDECAEGEPCGENADCVDSDGSFSCQCELGYSGDGSNCTPIMDSGPTLCDGEFGVCGPNATCVRVDGGYQCVCDAGFVDSGDDCFNVDECWEGSHNCSESASCTDRNGSFSCDCNPGYEGDGFTCTSNSSGFGTVWILAGVGSGIVVVAVAIMVIAALCIARKQPGRKPQLYAVNMLFGPTLWDEVNLDFNPVQPDSKFSLHSSIRSIFDRLEKTDAESTFAEQFPDRDGSVTSTVETHSVCTEVLSEEGGRKVRNSSPDFEMADPDAARNGSVPPLSQDCNCVTESGHSRRSKPQRLDPGAAMVQLGSEHLVISVHSSDAAYITTADCAVRPVQDESKDCNPAGLPLLSHCTQDRNGNSCITDAALYCAESDADSTVHRTASNFICSSPEDPDSGGYIYQDDAGSTCSDRIWNEDLDNFSGNPASFFSY